MHLKKYAVIFLILAGCTAPSENNSTNSFKAVSLDAADKLIKNSPELVLLDVRTPQEIQLGKIEGAIEMDYMQPTFKEEVITLDKEKTVLVYCAAGGRSHKAMLLMKDLGFKEVYNLEGGIEAWKSAGKPTTR
jgi:rhodanese-related sulfurtransferase